MKVTYIQHCGDDLAVVNAARVSFNKTSDWEPPRWQGEGHGLSQKDSRLIKYLAKHEHFSPFNHNFISMHVKAPLFVARQLVKHEYMPWNEVSRRYVDYEPKLFKPESLSERPTDGIKQGAGGRHPESSEALRSALDVSQAMVELYNNLVDRGFAPEQARMFLPQNMYTEWWWSGTLKAWAKMYNLRTHSSAQKECREIAEQCGKILKPLFPVSWSALTEWNK